MRKHAGAQRNACDRCHSLKNRCGRPNSHHGACERCERLQLECKYSEKGKAGRPKQKSRGIASPAQTDDQSSLDKFRFSSGPSEPSDACSSSHGDENAQTAALMPHGISSFDLNFDNANDQVDSFNWLSASDGGVSAQLNSRLFEDVCFSETTEGVPLKELHDLQRQLHALNSVQLEDNARRNRGLTGFYTPMPSNVSEILVVLERLTALLKSPTIGRDPKASRTTMARTPCCCSMLFLATHTYSVCSSPWSHHFTGSARAILLILKDQMAIPSQQLYLSGHSV
ncbi:hypothetical protein ONS96_003421 [Cadophora gregata f. sp. sojae]|nr:hypothetical protein ONS96_003421 [Cadophora gregata f. sp. sojae]